MAIFTREAAKEFANRVGTIVDAAPRQFTLEVARTMGHVHESGNYTGLSLPLKTPAQREFAAYVVAALNSFEPPAKTVAA